MGLAAYGKSLVDGVIHDRHLIAIRRSETMARRKVKTDAEKSIPEMADEVTRMTMCEVCRGGKLTAKGRQFAKLLVVHGGARRAEAARVFVGADG